MTDFSHEIWVLMDRSDGRESFAEVDFKHGSDARERERSEEEGKTYATHINIMAKSITHPSRKCVQTGQNCPIVYTLNC
jgi:hypothetical protein